MGTVIRRYPLPAFFLFAYLISWAVMVPLALQDIGILRLGLPKSIHYLSAFGPMLSALIVTAVLQGPSGLRGFLRDGFRANLGWGWLGFALLSPLGFVPLAIIVARIVGVTPPDLRGLGQVNFLPYLGFAAWALWIVTSGLGEEVGWRGFALPLLQRNRSVLRAALILGVPWAIWHTPAFFYLPNLTDLGVFLPGFVLGVLTGSVLFAWLYNITRGSILAVVLWHGTFNFVTASKGGEGIMGILASILVMVAAVIIALFYKRGGSRSSFPLNKGMKRSPGIRPYIRPGYFMTHIANPVNRRLGLFPILTVRGRRSGELRTIPLGRPIEYAGARYLVSGRGHTDWSCNLRAAGRGELMIGGVTETFRAVEVKGEERERIVAAYRAKLGRAVNGYFERIPDAADHPVFRVEPVAYQTIPAA